MSNSSLTKNTKLLNGSNLSLNEQEDNTDIVISTNGMLNNSLPSNLTPSSTSNSYSASRSVSVNELSTSSEQQVNGSKLFPTPALCCIVCGDSSSGKLK